MASNTLLSRKEYSIDELKKFLKEEKGLSPSVHRVNILKFLLENRIHPTAEEIYSHLKQTIPVLSLTTVYNTLKLFVKHNIVVPLTLEEEVVRYDINTEPHSHFKCLKCGKIYDIMSDNLNLPEIKEIEGHSVDFYQFYFYGICKECRKE